MKIGSSAWRQLIADGAGSVDIEVDAGMLDQFTVYAEELLHWAGKINLTKITDPADIALKHFLDSILPLQKFPPGQRLLDMGAGAGFPGIPLKIVSTSLQVTLVDSVRKKVSFMQHIVRTLSLPKTIAVHTRLEGLKIRQPCDLVVSRAFAPLEALIPLAIPLLAAGGTILAWKGQRAQAEQEYQQFLAQKHLWPSSIGDRAVQAEFETYALPVVNAERTAVLIKIADPGTT